MIDFNDLTPLGKQETTKFYPLDWYLFMMDIRPLNIGGVMIKPENAGFKGLFNTLVCTKSIPVKPGIIDDIYREVICFLRKGHSGDCLCWTPKEGILSI